MTLNSLNLPETKNTSGIYPYKFIFCPEWIYQHLVRSRANIYDIFFDDKILDLLSIDDLCFLNELNIYYNVGQMFYSTYNFNDVLNRKEIDENKRRKLVKIMNSFGYIDEDKDCYYGETIIKKINNLLSDNKAIDQLSILNKITEPYELVIVKNMILVVLKKGFSTYISDNNEGLFKFVTDINRSLHSVTEYIDYSRTNVFESYVRLLSKKELGMAV